MKRKRFKYCITCTIIFIYILIDKALPVETSKVLKCSSHIHSKGVLIENAKRQWTFLDTQQLF